ncbi:hypothetical protein D7I43_20195 [Micromonospora globbae]|uniref:LPXTG cell wall anchor domain-containing protein n=2 Tax=Micromonospora globbae TaxID=1894969 RepID=A0A420EYC7_9ACTN|nr:hypothetical protein [Micromonospora globbae]RKF25755.1 hypothetical protein D7I43_20195 [Micromonospora globbae]
MSVGRHAARLATVCAVLGGLVLLGGSPALADDDSVRVRSADSFRAGGSAQTVNVEVRRRSDGCVLLRTALGFRLEGLDARQVSVQVNYGGRWFPVPAGGSGTVTTTQTAPAKPKLCKGKGITVRYRVAFAAGTPGGRLSVTGEASNAAGGSLGRDTVSARVLGSRASASPTPSKTPSPTLSPSEAVVDDAATPAALAAPTGGPSTTNTKESSGMSPIMFVGLGLVAIGALLIVLLFRRSREDKEPTGGVVPPPVGNPGGTTYRSGGGPLAAPARPGPVYGQPPAAGGVYGTPAPRLTGGAVYGTRPAGGPAPTPTSGAPVAPTSGAPVAPASGAPAAPAPRTPVTPATPPAAGTPGAPAGEGPDHTVFMPRLPG